MPTVQGTAAGTMSWLTPVEIPAEVSVPGVAAGSIIFTAAQVGTPPTPYARAVLLPSTDIANLDAD